MNQGRDELDFLLISLGKLLDLVVEAVAETETFKPGDRPGPRRLAADPFQRSEIQDRIKDPALAIETAFFGKVSDGIPGFRGERTCIKRDLAVIRLDDVEDGADRGRFAGPVGSEEAKEFTAADFKRNAVNSDHRIKFFSKILDF